VGVSTYPPRTSRISPIYLSDLGFELRFLGEYQPLIINGRTSWVVDAHRGDRKRFIVRADEKYDRLYGA